MLIVRYLEQSNTRVRIGVLQDGVLRPIAVDAVASLLAMSSPQARQRIDEAGEPVVGDVTMRPPVDGATEVWASGVTYLRSRDGRRAESVNPSVYDQVYEAARPELFFKSVAWRVRGDGESIGVRADSLLNVPEPELAVVVNSRGEIFGYTICNDVSSRTLEGENPLYLPQAKIYAGACAVGPGIRPAWEIQEPRNLTIGIEVFRLGSPIWSGSTEVARMRRGLAELVSHLTFADHFPHGAVLSTGTGLVPEMTFNLQVDDEVVVRISGIGTLRNHVIEGKKGFDHLWTRNVRETAMHGAPTDGGRKREAVQ